MKTCTKCSIAKPLSDFYKLRSSKDGHAWACKKCVLVETREYKRKTRPQGPRIARERRLSLLRDGKKECKGCSEIKVLDEFYLNARGILHPYCKKCNNSRCLAWGNRNRERRNAYHREYDSVPENKARREKSRKVRVAASPRMVMQITLCHGLERKPTENPATIDDLMEMWRDQNGCCALSGVRMTWNQGRTMPTSISLDRIDPRGGYSKDNLRLLCQAVNAFKHTMSDAETIGMAHAITTRATAPVAGALGFI